jgi:hypothetical protein
LGTAIVLFVGTALAVLVWLIPKQFHDQQEARVIMLAFITGPLAILLSVRVMRRLSREEKVRVRAVRQKECELREEAKMSPEELLDLQKNEGTQTALAAPDRLLLSWVNLRDADLRKQDLRGAVLRGADLRGARLDSADLREADLRDCRLEGASLDGVISDDTTIWPASIDRRALETFRPGTAAEKESDAG